MIIVGDLVRIKHTDALIEEFVVISIAYGIIFYFDSNNKKFGYNVHSTVLLFVEVIG